jgi:hypothetical protein
VVELQSKVLGVEHPDTLLSMGDLAWTVADQGRAAEAEELYRKVVELQSKVLGLEHPDTLVSMGDLAMTVACQGRAAEAEVLYRQVLELQSKVLGPEHESALLTMSCLAEAVTNLGQVAEGEELYRHVLELQSKVLGSEHQHTLCTESKLASTIADHGRATAAAGLQQYPNFEWNDVLDPEQPDTSRNLPLVGTVESDGAEVADAEHYLVEAEQPTSLGVDAESSLAAISRLPEGSSDLSTGPENGPDFVDKFIASLLDNMKLRLGLDSVGDGMQMDEFERNFARILVIYANDLRAEAQEEGEMVAANLVRTNVKCVANRVRWNIGPEEVNGQHDMGSYLADKPLEKSSMDDDGYDVSTVDVEGLSVTKQPNFDDMRTFLFEALAFQQLILNVSAFILSQEKSKGDDREGLDGPPNSATAVERMMPSPLMPDVRVDEGESPMLQTPRRRRTSTSEDTASDLDWASMLLCMLLKCLSPYLGRTLSVAAQWTKKLMRPKLQAGLKRIEWRCVSFTSNKTTS